MTGLDEATIRLADTGELEEMRRRRDADPGIARRRGPGGESLLHIAARQWPEPERGAKIARALIDAGGRGERRAHGFARATATG